MSAEPEAEFGERIAEALRTVIDPELGYNIVDLGLIYEIGAAKSGAIRVVMTTTTRGCPATGYLRQGVEQAASAVPGVTSVEILLTYDPPWTPGMMSPEAMAHLGIAAPD